MAVSIYRSSDGSAPILTGQAGTLINLLQAVLVDGYGAKSPVGWTRAFSGTNLAVFRQPVGSNRMYLRIDDTGTSSARSVAYETMTDLSTGINPFPNPAQATGGLFILKSNTADATARPWILITNEKFFHLFIYVDKTSIFDTYPSLGGMAFGDFISYRPGDAFNTIHIAATSASSLITASCLGGISASSGGANIWLPGHFIARPFTQIGSSVPCGKVTNTAFTGCTVNSWASYDLASRVYGGSTNGTTSFTAIAYPNPVDGGFYKDKIYIWEGPGTGPAIRGELPGIWCPMHIRPLSNQGDTWSGTGPLAGKTFEIFQFTQTHTGQLVMETSDTW